MSSCRSIRTVGGQHTHSGHCSARVDTTCRRRPTNRSGSPVWERALRRPAGCVAEFRIRSPLRFTSTAPVWGVNIYRGAGERRSLLRSCPDREVCPSRFGICAASFSSGDNRPTSPYMRALDADRVP